MLLPILKTYIIDYHGTWLSTNTILGLNRFKAAKLKAEWILGIKPLLIAAQIKDVLAFSLEIRYWSRLDPDNVVGVGTKALVDQLRYLNVLTNDDKRYWKGLTVHPDETLKHNHYRISLHVHSEAEEIKKPS
jgi:hypothetical protein